jgi:hypothetical protein
MHEASEGGPRGGAEPEGAVDPIAECVRTHCAGLRCASKKATTQSSHRLNNKTQITKNLRRPPGRNFRAHAQLNLTERVVMPASAESGGDYINQLS